MTLETNTSVSTVYGPVYSWRVGMSLGIDLICQTSVCSYNCIYCQLGQIQQITNERRHFVPTSKVIEDFLKSEWKKSDILTYSGSGEPTLALNLGEVVRELQQITNIPQLVLTNGTLLHDPHLIEELQPMDKVFVKLDAADESMFQRINRPVSGITLQTILENIKNFRPHYPGYLGIQTMFLPSNRRELDGIINHLIDIQPDEVQLNTPKRPYPRYWHISSRGGHTEELRPYDSTPLRTITPKEAQEMTKRLREETGLNIVSVYKED